jgi:transposase
MFLPVPACARRQSQCGDCGAVIHVRHREHQCTQCQELRRRSDHHGGAVPAPATPSPPPLSLFGRPAGCVDQLTLVERAAIVTMRSLGWAADKIADTVRCSANTVTLWWQRWRDTRSLDDSERSGRPRSTTEEQDDDIVDYSDKHVTAVPRTIVNELELPVDRRTVRRRLNDAELFGFVQRAEHDNAHARLASAAV